MLLEFPSVVDAVECAVAVKLCWLRGTKASRRTGVCSLIGINLGDILIEGDDILGDGVNVAARLEGIAEPGGICISSSAYDQVRGKVEVEFADLGEQSLKNIKRPVRAYAAKWRGRVVGAPVMPTQAERPLSRSRFPTSPPSQSCHSRTCPVIRSRSILRTGWSRTSSRRSRGSNGCS